MRPFPREWILAVAVMAALGLGIGYDTLADEDITGTDPPPEADEVLIDRAIYCPPLPAKKGVSGTAVAATGPGSTASVTVAAGGAARELDDERALIRTFGNTQRLTLTTFGGWVAAGAAVDAERPPEGLGASRCSGIASSKWYFPYGSSALGYDERLLIYNPFPDEAVVRVTFFTPEGERAKANLADVAVPARETTTVAVNEFILGRPLVGAGIEAVRGRVVAWRSMFEEARGEPPGIHLSLGALGAAETVYLPAGVVDEDAEEVLTLLNPSDEEALAMISLATAKEPVQPPKLVEVAIPPRSARSFSLATAVRGTQRDIGGVSAIVRTINEVPIVAERTMSRSDGSFAGVSSEVGTAAVARQWLAAPPVVRPTQDALVLLNPGTARATASITLITRSGRAAPKALRAVTIAGGRRRRVALDGWTTGRPVMAVVEADQGIVVEREAAGRRGDAATMMASPVTPSGL